MSTIKIPRAHLEKIRKLERKKHHAFVHQIHKKHNISKKTLFYVKEYGPHSNVPRTIIKESLKVLIFASIISSFGGLAIEEIKTLFVSIIPLIVLLPTLNDMIGDYGSIVSSKFSTMLHENQANGNLWKNKKLRVLFAQIVFISTFTALLSSSIALIISHFSGYSVAPNVALKVFLIALIDVVLLVNLLFFTSVIAGKYFFKKQEDPNNFLIPISTSIADFGNMMVLALLVMVFF